MEHARAKPLAQVLSTATPESFRAAVERAAALLRAGEVVALPTETVYGLAANALDARAVEKIYAIKGRPAHNPIIVHGASVAMLRACVSAWPDLADRMAAAFWPGPLTLVLPRAPIIPDIVTAGGPTVGVRWPDHPFIQAVIRACGLPLAAPSANLSNQISPTTAAHVRQSLGRRIALIIDGGPARVGIESTVLDLTVTPPRVLRPGMIHPESLMAVTGRLASGPEDSPHLKSPGLLRKHYSPKARLFLWSWRDAAELQARARAAGLALPQVHVIAHTHLQVGEGFARVSALPRHPAPFARSIYAELHRADELGAQWIIVETPPDAPPWHGIADRLRRAAV
jgi:L-threonylcarbamoyladenylate synthase